MASDSISYRHPFASELKVYWDPNSNYLHSPKPREWSYARWLLQIRDAVKGEYGVALAVTPQTQWRNVDEALKSELTAVMNGTASA